MASEFYSETGLNTSGRACCCAAQGSVQRQPESGGQERRAASTAAKLSVRPGPWHHGSTLCVVARSHGAASRWSGRCSWAALRRRAGRAGATTGCAGTDTGGATTRPVASARRAPFTGGARAACGSRTSTCDNTQVTSNHCIA